MKPQYRYVRVGRHGTKPRFLSIQQNCLFLPWFLFWYGKPFGFRGQGFRRALGGCKSIGRVALTLFYYRLWSPNADSVIELPVFGQLCLKVQNGYKVFDLRRQVVVKVFSQEINPAIVRYEIEQVRRVGTHRFAPSVRRWNIEEGWYEEDYLNGYRLVRPNGTTFMHMLQESLIPLFARMILATPPQEVRVLEYAQGLGELIRGDQSERWEHRRLDGAKVATIRSFVEAISDRLRLSGDRLIALVCTHGDFAARHVITTENGPMIVDWETGRYRSALFDLYDFFFKQLRRGRPVPDMAVAMEQAISQLQECLALHASASSSSLLPSLHATEVYRWSYYIERVCSSLRGRSKPMTDSELDRIRQRVDAYKVYEAQLLSRANHHLEITH